MNTEHGLRRLREAAATPAVRRAAPIAVSAVALAWVLARFDLARVAAALSWRVALVLLPALLLYGAVTLGIEAASILRLVPTRPSGFGAWTAARIKCASYLLQTVNYALGGAALTVLLRRRAALGLAEAAGIVLLISLSDLLVVAALGALAATTGRSDAREALAGSLAAAGVAGWLAGLLLLRAPISLGPLDRLRSLAVFEALRATPLSRLGQLLALRIAFSACFIAVAGAAFAGFGIEIAPTRLVVGMMILAVIGALPIAVAGLGTGQVAAVYVFEGVAPPETLIALSLVLSGGLIALRVAMGLVFAREYTREALRPAEEARP